MKKNILKIIHWIPVIVLMIIIFLFSSQNAGESSQTSSLPAVMLANIIDIGSDGGAQETLINQCQFIVRKSAHFIIYMVLGMLSFNAFRESGKINKKLKIAFSTLLCLAYAVSDEIHQYFVPGRSCQFRDVIIDLSGSITGILLFVLFIKVYKKLKFR